jgi:hypothetical protein
MSGGRRSPGASGHLVREPPSRCQTAPPESGLKTNLLDPQAVVKDHLRIPKQMSHGEGWFRRHAAPWRLAFQSSYLRTVSSTGGSSTDDRSVCPSSAACSLGRRAPEFKARPVHLERLDGLGPSRRALPNPSCLSMQKQIATLYRHFPARESLIAACFETRVADTSPATAWNGMKAPRGTMSRTAPTNRGAVTDAAVQVPRSAPAAVARVGHSGRHSRMPGLATAPSPITPPGSNSREQRVPAERNPRAPLNPPRAASGRQPRAARSARRSRSTTDPPGNAGPRSGTRISRSTAGSYRVIGLRVSQRHRLGAVLVPTKEVWPAGGIT